MRGGGGGMGTNINYRFHASNLYTFSDRDNSQKTVSKGAQWLSGRALDSSLTGVTALWSLSKTHLS